MSSDDHSQFGENEGYEWGQFEDSEPLGVKEFSSRSLRDLPEDAAVRVMDSYFPNTTIRRKGELVICEIEEHQNCALHRLRESVCRKFVLPVFGVLGPRKLGFCIGPR
jgi:hypothetical protein